jgi:hypothetical protein
MSRFDNTKTSTPHVSLPVAATLSEPRAASAVRFECVVLDPEPEAVDAAAHLSPNGMITRQPSMTPEPSGSIDSDRRAEAFGLARGEGLATP